jgi:hypothetical protein
MAGWTAVRGLNAGLAKEEKATNRPIARLTCSGGLLLVLMRNLKDSAKYTAILKFQARH